MVAPWCCLLLPLNDCKVVMQKLATSEVNFFLGMVHSIGLGVVTLVVDPTPVMDRQDIIWRCRPEELADVFVQGLAQLLQGHGLIGEEPPGSLGGREDAGAIR